ncbi:MAG: CDP-glucose 4,6-dehydratase, partial [Bacteroidota bacterium]|nr:CDP-glucose 4,6-dehydratase [Bacteroidota bacterium]
MIDILKKAYAEKKVFLTGHTGFKGAWMVEVLHYLGAEITGYALAPETQPSLYDLLKTGGKCRSVIADICDRERIAAEINDSKPDFIFHLAAQAIVRRSYSQPVDTFMTNVMGTANLLDGMKTLEGPCSTVIITTDKVYENKEWWYPYRENDHLGGYDPYSASKACAEIVASAYRSSYFNSATYLTHKKAVATARAGNVIGGGDWSTDRIIPDLIRSLEAKEPLTVRNPLAVRPWQHVLEPIGAYLWLGLRLNSDPEAYAQAYNFGPYPEDTLPVQSLVEMA